jgi:acyl-CoA dehydrogenase
MPFALTEEERQLADTASRLLADARAADAVPPAWEHRSAGINRALWQQLTSLGMLGVGVAEERSGSGGGCRELCILAEQFGYALRRVPFAGTAAVLALPGHEVTGIVDGSLLAVPAWETFPAAVVPRTRDTALRLSGPTVSGTLQAVAFGMDADLLLAFAGEVPVLVDLPAEGVRRTPVEALDVTEPMAAITLTEARATALHPVGSLASVLAVLAAELLGTGQRALDSAVEYAGQRHQFGRPIGSFQAIKHLLADRHVQLDAARLLVEEAATRIDEANTDADATARTALVATSDAADEATRDALQVHGGIGFTWEHPCHVFLKRARARRSLLGSVGTQLDALADHVFGVR